LQEEHFPKVKMLQWQRYVEYAGSIAVPVYSAYAINYGHELILYKTYKTE
jgi:hypothetical protein